MRLAIGTMALSTVLMSCSTHRNEPDLYRFEGVIQLGYSSEEDFEQRYSDLLEQEFPGVRLHIVPIGRRGMESADEAAEILKQNPDLDVLYAPWYNLSEFIESGALIALDTLIKKDGYDLSSFIPSSIELARQYGSGTLYGLPTTYNSSAILINEDLFEQYNVELLAEQPSWQDVLGAAMRFAHSGGSGQAVKGIEFPFSSSALLREIGWSQGLTMYDDKKEIVSFNTERWKQIWQLVIPAIQSGSIHFEPESPSLSSFINGERAMYYGTIRNLSQLSRSEPKFRWSVVTQPVDPSAQSRTSRFNIDGLYAVASTTDQPELAWQLVQFLCSETAARWVDQNSVLGASTLISQNKLSYADAFYKLVPTMPQIDALTLPMIQFIDQMAQDVAANKISLDAALDELQAQAIAELAANGEEQ
ncbi:ABC transporter substrate-binding protein [Paenibacillus xylaniclasticus]|uniref:ABC transporter substrate-binding protein n=1 Tax=Paenibacillus xylaniclasticus TaxID=588083 RepID=UPI000FDB2A54|nr:MULTISPECIES: extracellular solute-binding protein [Paenibacillus]